MYKIIFSGFLIVLLTCQLAAGQKIIEVKSKTSSNGEFLIIDEKIKATIRSDRSYQLNVTGINAAHMALKVVAIPKEIYTPIPEVLKTVLPGIAGTRGPSAIGDTLKRAIGDSAKLSELTKSIDEITTRLKKVREEAIKLHRLTRFHPNLRYAVSAFQAIDSLYGAGSPDLLSDMVREDIQWLLTVKVVADNFMKLKPSYDPLGINSLHVKISIICQELTKTDYIQDLQYVLLSQKGAVSNLISKPFSGSEDLVELDIILIDTFTNDTLLRENRTLFTAGGPSVGLSFSTGFFYTHQFSDTPYYLKQRADENLSVLGEKTPKYDLSVGALGHLYYKVSSEFRAGPSLGVVVSPFDGKTRFLLGASVLLGKEKTVVLSVGKAFAKVKTLSSSIDSDSQGLYLPKGTTAVPTYDQIKQGWFIGISYNLASTRK